MLPNIRIVRVLILVCFSLFLFGTPQTQTKEDVKITMHSIHKDGKFYNLSANFHRGKFSVVFPFIASRLFEMFFGGGSQRTNCNYINVPFDSAVYAHNSPNKITWVGHSTFLIQMDGINFLTDPVWSNKVGPFDDAIGSKRYTPPGIKIDQLPKIDFIIISHNHYDHLDLPTIRELAKRNPEMKIFVGLGVKTLFDDEEIGNVTELDWWESVKYRTLEITFTPTQHFSGRGLNDGDATLWGSYIIYVRMDPFGISKKLFFCGDSGYFFGFKAIGEKFGPFDVVCLPIGAYEPEEMMRPVHMNPDEAVQAYLDLRGKMFCAMHWGTFDLSNERCDDPPKRLAERVKQLKLDPNNFKVFQFGETVEW